MVGNSDWIAKTAALPVQPRDGDQGATAGKMRFEASAGDGAGAYELLFAQAASASAPIAFSALGDPQAADYPARLVELFRSAHGVPVEGPLPELIQGGDAPAAGPPDSAVAAARALMGEDAADAAAESPAATAADAALQAAEEMLLALLEAGDEESA
jgi:hypothetical protein